MNSRTQLFLLVGLLAFQYASSQDLENDVLLVLGGFGSGFETAAVEAIDFSEDPGCSQSMTPFPSERDWQIGLTDDEDRPMSCLGFDFELRGECLVYSAGRWVPGPTLQYERADGAAVVELEDGRYFITGGILSEDFHESELFDKSDGQFHTGPDLPHNAYESCLVEVQPGKVFLAGGLINGDTSDAAYIIDLDFVDDPLQLPDMPQRRRAHVCGKYGNDVVVAGGTLATSDIFNIKTGVWRPGPSFPAIAGLEQARSVPFGDSFLVVGGADSGFDYQDTIYEYDGENEEWILREETLLQEKYLTGLAWVKKEMIDC